MKRLFAALAVILSIGFASCQCSDKPPIPPVEDESAQAQPSDYLNDSASRAALAKA
jgi:hypothetical protein